MGNFVKACALSEVPKGECRTVEVNDRQLAVVNVDGEIHCLDNTCPHQGGPLGEGSVEGKVLTCPWHAWEFDVTTGVSPVNADAKVDRIPSKVEGDSIFVEL
jgi:nitrite reductase (NADH) small subunit